jgi:hypothetical protein
MHMWCVRGLQFIASRVIYIKCLDNKVSSKRNTMDNKHENNLSFVDLCCHTTMDFHKNNNTIKPKTNQLETNNFNNQAPIDY